MINKKVLLLSALISGLSLFSNSYAATNAQFTAFPPSTAERAAPIVMLTMSRDHQYFFKAYNDYSDLDPENNNGIDTSYSNIFGYYGYFQSDVCYSYDNGVFIPKELQNTSYYCDDVQGEWSGNFLNWVSMTRMDIVRKIFYGGKRSTDTATETILERAYLPPDAHAYVKYYNGTDIDKLTPFTVNSNNEDGFDNQTEGLSICNVTDFNDANINTGSNTDADSHNNTNPPVMRFAKGNYRLWASNERVQCAWERFSNGNRGPSAPFDMTIGGVDTDKFTYEGTTYDFGTNAGDHLDVSSGIDAYASAPSNTNQLTISSERDIIVRVKTCVADNNGQIIDTESCFEYPGVSGVPSYKPIGLFQQFGEQGEMLFGLTTGSYKNNTQGGTVRKNVSSFADEVNAATDGTFINGTNSIVKTMDAFRIYSYRYQNTSYGDCNGNRSDISNNSCRSWGNPISEIYRDSLLYLAGKPEPSHSNIDDGTYISALDSSPTWASVITVDNMCAEMSNIVLNASVNTYDTDSADIALSSFGSQVDTWTDKIGDGENIHGNDFFIGRNGTDNSENCTAKTVGNLSGIAGVCPEGPSKNGGYGLAGLAHYAHQTDLYPTIDGNQTLTTYGVALASASPIIEVPITTGGSAGKTITIIPSGIQYNGGSGALVDFQVVTKHRKIAPSDDKYFGKFFVSYEVSVAGNDYDVDASGTIEYLLDESDEEIIITTTALTESAGSTAGVFGFVVDGTTEDGFHGYSGDAGSSGGANYTSTIAGVPGCSNCRSLISRTDFGNSSQYGPRSHTFSVGSSSASQLESPLFYASKWGGFVDSNNDNEPDATVEWDRIDNFTGAPLVGGDGLPDNYFFVNNPARLVIALENTLQAIIAEQQRSGTAPANLANADGSGGIVVQAIFFEKEENVTTQESVIWTGELHAFFVDEFGFFREDNDGSGVQGQLDSVAIDRIFFYDFDEITEQLQIKRYQLTDNTKPYDPANNNIVLIDTKSAKELQTIWSANKTLSALNNSTIKTQRSYNDLINTTAAGRYVFTFIDRNKNGIADDGERVGFTESNVSNNNANDTIFKRYFGIDNLGNVNNIVNFIRGEENAAAGTRSRALTENINGTDTVVIKRLGDIINSTPTIVGAPTENYDIRFGDSSYTAFREKYANRRQVMYVGANDGLLHAFNVGFRTFSADSKLSFKTNDPQDASKTAQPLGAELWAYAPFNLLSHLRWLTSDLYSHVFYVDGEPSIHEVNIFPPDDVHPNGWGTILVVGMRLGGGTIGLDLDGDNSNNISNACKDLCSRSAYIVLDVTDPERPPKVLAEISDLMLAKINPTDPTVEQLGFTSQVPALVKNRAPSNAGNWLSPSANDWKLVFGSGPKFLNTFNTNNAARIYTFDLEINDASGNLKPNTLAEQKVKNPNDVENSFIGNLVTKDWDNNYIDDVIYFGTVGEDLTIVGDTNIGSLFRYRIANDDTKLFIDPQRPISTTPLAISNRGRDFVYFGTGRYLHEPDLATVDTEKYIGVIEPVDINGVSDYSDLVTENNLINVTKIEVKNNADIQESPNLSGLNIPSSFIPANSAGSTDINTFQKLQNEILTDLSIEGWLRTFKTFGIDPNERISADSAFARTQLFFTSFIPTENLCAATSGESALYGVDLITGTPSAFGAFGFDANGIALTSVSLGTGRSTFPIVLTTAARGANKGIIISQKDTGEITQTEVTLGEPVKLQRINWREIFNF